MFSRKEFKCRSSTDYCVMLCGDFSGGDWRTGIRLNSTKTASRFKEVVIRKNVINDVAAPAGITSSLKGLHLQRCGELIVEKNVLGNISDTAAVYFENVVSRKFFNNQDNGGKLLRAYNGSSFAQELEDAVQDVLLPL